jgi:hypothetical protein
LHHAAFSAMKFGFGNVVDQTNTISNIRQAHCSLLSACD